MAKSPKPDLAKTCFCCNSFLKPFEVVKKRKFFPNLSVKETCSYFSSKLGNKEAVKFFGADINATTKGNLTPLHIAITAGNGAGVRFLLQHGAKVHDQSNILKTAVNANGRQCKEIVQALLAYGLTVDSKDATDSDFLYAAVAKGYLKIVEELLKCGADVNTLSIAHYQKGFTPLHSAAKNRQEDVAKLLISYRADTNVQDKAKKTPIFYAIENGDLKITKLLLINGANVKDNPELLNIAVETKCIEIIEALLQHGADVNARDNVGRTALHVAARNNDENGQIAKLLLSKGGNVNSMQKNGTTALHIASQSGHIELLKVLLECGANVDVRVNCRIFEMLTFKPDKVSRTALHIASQEKHVEVVETLLDYGSNINITSGDNYTPLDFATNNNSHRDYSDSDSDDDRGDYPYKIATAKVLKRHIVKMKAANLYVSEKNLRSVRNELNDFREECQVEISHMKRVKISNTNISFYDIMAKSTSSLVRDLRNKGIEQVLKADDYKMKFPIYASMIKSYFRKGMQRKELLEQANTISYFLFNNLPELPYDCTEKIFGYLSDEDLRVLMDACKHLSNSNLNVVM